MRVSSYAVARPAYYDRAAVSTSQSYGADTAPHATTTRFTTTVAAGTKLIVEIAQAFTLTTSVAAPAARGFSSVVVNAGGTSVDLARVDQIQLATSQVATQQLIPLAVTIYAGETVTGSTFNGSTGGTLFHVVAYKGTTYAA